MQGFGSGGSVWTARQRQGPLPVVGYHRQDVIDQIRRTRRHPPAIARWAPPADLAAERDQHLVPTRRARHPTKLPGPMKGTYFSLYVILDLFSRYIVGWQVATRESAAVYQELVEACPFRPWRADDREVHRAALRRPRHHQEPQPAVHVDDSPYSEANFRTLNDRPRGQHRGRGRGRRVGRVTPRLSRRGGSPGSRGRRPPRSGSAGPAPR